MVNVNEWLRRHFAQVDLNEPLFYHVPFGLRFELGYPPLAIEEPTYFEQLQQRAVELFEQLFGDGRKMYIRTRSFVWADELEGYQDNHAKEQDDGADAPIIEKWERDTVSLHDFLNKEGVSLIVEEERIPEYDEDTGVLDGYHIYCGLECTIAEIDYPALLAAASYKDFPNKGRTLHEQVYYIDPVRKLIFYMYDDRGLDIVSLDDSLLRHLYTTYNDWLLDYDRERMDAMFHKVVKGEDQQ